MEEENLKQILEEITTKVDELSKAIKTGKEDVEEESQKLTKIKEKIGELTKYIEEARKGAVETKIDVENRIKENPLICLLGAFIGGLIIGHFTKRDNTK